MKLKQFALSLTALIFFAAVTLQAQSRHLSVKAGDAESLLSAIEKANKMNTEREAPRVFIFVPDGFYDLGDRVLTTITGYNIAIIGQSMERTIIRNKPDVKNEGIGKTAVLRSWTTGTYLQDITLRNDLDYYASGAAGRAVCLQDRGTRTICQRVRMLSYQDTYYADSELCQHYMKGCEIHGTIDFICGAGDVYFDYCHVVTERRHIDGTGRCVIAAPRTSKTKWGFVFNHLTIENRESEYYFARAWHTHPRLTLLNTRLLTPKKLRKSRFDAEGIRTTDNAFAEYNTTDSLGKNITPKSHVVTFTCKDDKRDVETIITKKDAAKYTVTNVFGDWRPDRLAKSMEKEAAKNAPW